MGVNPFTQLDQAYAAARVASDGTSDTSSDPDGYREGRFVSTVLASTGVYTLTLDPGADEAEVNITPPRATAPVGNANLHANQTSDTSITVSTFVGTVPTSMGFELMVRKVRSAP